jgi:general secretion pathway protein D
MKTLFTTLLVALAGLEVFAQTPPAPSTPVRTRPPRYLPTLPTATTPTTSVATTPAQPEETIPPGTIDFAGVDVNQVLDVYAKLVNRTILRAALPESKIVLKTQTPLTKSEAIQALQAVLALNNVSVVNIGEKFAKAAQSDQANTLGGKVDQTGSTNIPDLGTYTTHITQLQYVKPSVMVPLITPFSKLPNAAFPIDDNGILVLRDYAENVKRMLEMIEKIDISTPTEFVSEVIPIRYAKVDEISSALSSLGGGGGASVSIGSAPSSTPISGFGNRSSGISGMNSGAGGIGGIPGSGGFGGGLGGNSFQRPGTTANGSPNTGTSFQQRLQNIVNRAGTSSGGGANGQQDIQLFGTTKIIPNESSSTLLVYATRQDMEQIKEIIKKLDVPLAQVYIEAVIMNVSLGSQFNLGFSAAQNPKNLGSGILGGGGMNNGQPFANLVQDIILSTNSSGLVTKSLGSISSSLGTNGGAFASALPGGFGYFANLGPNYEVAVKAAESDSHASIIQRPRLLASQSKPAQFFVGETRPYVTSTYNNGFNGGYGGSSYSQLSVGVELDVTPFINPDGEVTMEINQEVDDFNGTTSIAGVGDVPNTTKRSLNTTITVRDKDTIMLGGFIKSDKSTSKSGVPFLVDIPLLGNLFSSRNDIKGRSELVVMMRPTVMRTPKLVAEQTVRETQRLPGVSSAAADDASYEHKLLEAERLRELRAAKNGSNTNGFFNVLVPAETVETNTTAPGAMVSPAPASTTVDPAGVAMERAKLEFELKSADADAAKVHELSSAQKKQLDALLNGRVNGSLSEAEYRSLRDKVINAEK